MSRDGMELLGTELAIYGSRVRLMAGQLSYLRQCVSVTSQYGNSQRGWSLWLGK